jgi:hypothetical protein
MTDLGDADTIRRWCERLASTAFMQSIRPNGQPYLDRYFLAGWNPIRKRSGPAVFLHHFVGSDPAVAVHSHPWGWSSSLILVGGYREERCRGAGDERDVRCYVPGDVNVLRPDDRHRIDLIGDDCWTLFLAGDLDKAWSFYSTC